MGGRIQIAVLAVAALILAVGLVLLSRTGTDSGPAPGEAGAGGSAGDRAEAEAASRAPIEPTGRRAVSEKHPSGVNLLPGLAELTGGLHDASQEPEEDLRIVEELIRMHVRTFDGIPQGGENIEIVQYLTGRNERNLALLPPDHPAISEKGELLDRWGAPYHFHPVSRKILEVRSAGPDGDLWTEDDLFLGEEEEPQTASDGQEAVATDGIVAEDEAVPDEDAAEPESVN